MVEKFLGFYRGCKDTEMPHEERKYQNRAENRLDRLMLEWEECRD
jgi:uncharacterized membrane protein